MMNETARKYIDLFRQVKIATAATVDAQGHPQAHCLQCGRCVEFCPAGAIDRLHP